MAKKHISAKQKILQHLSKQTGNNTLTVDQARNRFKIWNVAARVHELRKDGFNINTLTRVNKSGNRSKVYALAQ